MYLRVEANSSNITCFEHHCWNTGEDESNLTLHPFVVAISCTKSRRNSVENEHVPWKGSILKGDFIFQHLPTINFPGDILVFMGKYLEKWIPKFRCSSQVSVQQGRGKNPSGSWHFVSWHQGVLLRFGVVFLPWRGPPWVPDIFAPEKMATPDFGRDLSSNHLPWQVRKRLVSGRVLSRKQTWWGPHMLHDSLEQQRSEIDEDLGDTEHIGHCRAVSVDNFASACYPSKWSPISQVCMFKWLGTLRKIYMHMKIYLLCIYYIYTYISVSQDLRPNPRIAHSNEPFCEWDLGVPNFWNIPTDIHSPTPPPRK